MRKRLGNSFASVAGGPIVRLQHPENVGGIDVTADGIVSSHQSSANKSSGGDTYTVSVKIVNITNSVRDHVVAPTMASKRRVLSGKNPENKAKISEKNRFILPGSLTIGTSLDASVKMQLMFGRPMNFCPVSLIQSAVGMRLRNATIGCSHAPVDLSQSGLCLERHCVLSGCSTSSDARRVVEIGGCNNGC